ncbi:MAG: radical SAM/SPASM domain-containing protein [Bacteroidia bacterium]|jgi:radical SAM protein with 4Fe4S-binding SPASM domain
MVWDFIQIVRLITLPKLLNTLQLRLSYSISKTTGRVFHFGKPLHISVEPTTSCNLRCPECPSGLRAFSRPTGMLQPELLHKIVDELHPSLASINFYFQGEPYLNTRLHEMIAYAAKKKIYTAVSTNAHYLSAEIAEATVKSGLHRLIISIDGNTQETYAQYRIGGRLEKVIEGTKAIITAKKKLRSRTPHVIFQFLVVKPNEHETEAILKRAKELGVNEVRFKTAQLYDFEHGNPLIPEQERYSRYRKGLDGRWHLKNKLVNSCWRMWQGCVFTWDGSVVPCCFDKDAQHKLGSIQSEPFEQLWRNEAYSNFRAAVLSNRSQIDICRNCTEGTKVWA